VHHVISCDRRLLPTLHACARIRRQMLPNQPEVTPALVAEHGLKPDEYDRILTLIGRAPTLTELGIFSAMWNEHCSYKSSKVHLRTLPTTGRCVISGTGRERKAFVDIGGGPRLRVQDGEPQTIRVTSSLTKAPLPGVGGILRDVFTMGARPVACLNAAVLRGSGPPDDPPSWSPGVVAGIGAAMAILSGSRRWAARSVSNRRLQTAIFWSMPWRWAWRKPTRSSTPAAVPAVGMADRLSRLEDRSRTASTAPPWALGRVRREFRGEAPDRAGRRSVRREALARSLPGNHGDGAASSRSRTWERRALNLFRAVENGPPKAIFGVTPRPRQSAVPGNRNDGLRDDAVGEPGAHASWCSSPKKEADAEGDFP